MKNTNNSLSKAWRQYEAGKEYKRRIGLYETVRRNERYYRGEQWNGAGQDLPKPVFNVIRRITDYFICTVASDNVGITYSDENLPYARSSLEAQAIRAGIQALDKNAAYRWECCRMNYLIYQLLTDAALCGDGILYCYWDAESESGQPFSGDIMTTLVDSINVFPADVNRADIQSQEYIILSGRQSVGSLRKEADAHGVPADKIAKILPDREYSLSAGDLGNYELEGDDEGKATYLIKFWREDGVVCFEKSTRDCIIHRAKTAFRLYPLAYFNWHSTKNSFHGVGPVNMLIPNQNFINRAYAMAMKHMTDTAFSKIIYDKTKIPEWSNKVGEAVAAVGGGNMADAVSVVGVGQLQDGYMELIDRALAVTKELAGATDSALGNVIPTNTSAILALQESSRRPLEQVRANFSHCLEDLAVIWADMMCAYYPRERLLPYRDGEQTRLASVDFSLLSRALIRAKVEIGSISRYTSSGTQALLDKLLEGGHITALQYLEQLPEGALCNRMELIAQLRASASQKETASETDADAEKEKENGKPFQKNEVESEERSLSL